MIKYICLARFEEALKVKRDSQGTGTERDESTPIHYFKQMRKLRLKKVN